MKSPGNCRDIVLIHGAWQGSWVWSSLIPHLKLKGFCCHPVDMPGNGHNDTKPQDVSMEIYMTYLRGVLDGVGKPVILIGHSSGGIIASQLAELESKRVAGIVYLAGMMLPSGMKFAELVDKFSKKNTEMLGIIPYLKWSKDGETSTVNKVAARKIFYHDCSKEKAGAAAARLKPHPQRGRNISARITKRNFWRVPRAYIEATMDLSIPHRLQRYMQNLVPGARRYVIEAGHAPHLAKPEALAGIIDKAITEIRN